MKVTPHLMRDYMMDGDLSSEFEEYVSSFSKLSSSVHFIKMTEAYLQELKESMVVDSFSDPVIEEYYNKLEFLLCSLSENIEKVDGISKVVNDNINQLVEKALKIKNECGEVKS